MSITVISLEKKKKPTLEDMLKANRLIIVALFIFPIFGMIAGGVLIYMRKPNNMWVALGALMFFFAQYVVILRYFFKSFDKMIEKQEEKNKQEPDASSLDREENE